MIEIPNSIYLPEKPKTSLRDSSSFESFERMCLNYQDVPEHLIRRHLDLGQNIQKGSKGRFSGRGVINLKDNNLKVFLLKYLSEDSVMDIVATFSGKNQKDVKTFSFYCRTCSETDFVARIGFISNTELEVKYITPNNSEKKLLPRDMEVKKVEKWVIDDQGIFVCISGCSK